VAIHLIHLKIYHFVSMSKVIDYEDRLRNGQNCMALNSTDSLPIPSKVYDSISVER